MTMHSELSEWSVDMNSLYTKCLFATANHLFSSLWKGGNHGTHDQLGLNCHVTLTAVTAATRNHLNLPGELQLSRNLSLNLRQEVCSTPWP